MTQKEIVTALRCCASNGANSCVYCKECPADGEDCETIVQFSAADLIENQQREIEALKAAFHKMAADFVAWGRIDYWFCDDVPNELHMKHQPKNDGNYENGPCAECVKEYYLQQANDNPSANLRVVPPLEGEARAVEDASPYETDNDGADGDEICRAD